MTKEDSAFLGYVYFTLMTRWGNPSEHCYVHAVTTRDDEGDLAKERGEQEKIYRGGKYSPTVGTCSIDGLRSDSFGNEGNALGHVWSCIANKYYLASSKSFAVTTNPSDRHPDHGDNYVWDEMSCFVGIFSSAEKAKSFGEKIFPQWSLAITRHPVELTQERK